MRKLVLPDFDGDQYLSPEDLAKAVQHLTRDELTGEEISLVCSKVLYFKSLSLQTFHLNLNFESNFIINSSFPGSGGGGC